MRASSDFDVPLALLRSWGFLARSAVPLIRLSLHPRRAARPAPHSAPPPPSSVVTFATKYLDMSVKDVCSELLKDLDEDIFEYIVGALEEYQSSGKDGDADETMSMVSSFLESAGYAKDEEAAMEKANELINRLKSPSASASSGSGPQKLSENVNKMTLSSSLVAEKPTTTSNKNTLIEDKSATTSKKSNKSKKDLSTSAYERAEEQALELETELHAARIASIQA